MMKNSCRLLLILIGLWMANVSLAQKTFRNPIITGMNPDPSISGWEMIFTWLLLPLNIFPVCRFIIVKTLFIGN